jgi:osmotically-inducible protein OsmY
LDGCRLSTDFEGEHTMKSAKKLAAGHLASLTFVLLAACAGGAARQEAEQPPVPQAESVPPVSDDKLITTKVKAALVNEPSIRTSKIDVETFKGVVQLSGYVETVALADRAVDVARGIDGVKSVRNEMRVR